MCVCHVVYLQESPETRTGGKKQEPFKMDYNDADLFITTSEVWEVQWS